MNLEISEQEAKTLGLGLVTRIQLLAGGLAQAPAHQTIEAARLNIPLMQDLVKLYERIEEAAQPEEGLSPELLLDDGAPEDPEVEDLGPDA